MSLFSKLTGGEKAPQEGQNRRAHARHAGAGERLVLMLDGKDTDRAFDIVDISEGGLCFEGADKGGFKGGHYLEFRFLGAETRGGGEATGFATVVRAFDDKVACRFPPQPKLKKFLRRYLS